MTGNGLTGQTSGIRDGKTDVSSPLSIPGKNNLKHKIICSLNENKNDLSQNRTIRETQKIVS